MAVAGFNVDVADAVAGGINRERAVVAHAVVVLQHHVEAARFEIGKRGFIGGVEIIIGAVRGVDKYGGRVFSQCAAGVAADIGCSTRRRFYECFYRIELKRKYSEQFLLVAR